MNPLIKSTRIQLQRMSKCEKFNSNVELRMELGIKFQVMIICHALPKKNQSNIYIWYGIFSIICHIFKVIMPNYYGHWNCPCYIINYFQSTGTAPNVTKTFYLSVCLDHHDKNDINNYSYGYFYNVGHGKWWNIENRDFHVWASNYHNFVINTLRCVLSKVSNAVN